MSFPVALTLIFIVLKLTGFIAWSWWFVLSPIVLGILVVLGLIIWAVYK